MHDLPNGAWETLLSGVGIVGGCVIAISGPTPVFYLRQHVDECTKTWPEVTESIRCSFRDFVFWDIRDKEAVFRV